MNRSEYLNELKQHLQGFPQDELEDILFDYEEHFHIGVSKGKSEEEISMELGDPKDIAQNFKNNYSYDNYNHQKQDKYKNHNKYKNANNDDYENNYHNHNYDKPNNSSDTSRKLLFTILLLFFNLVVVLGPYLALAGLLLGGYVAGISFIVAGFFLLFGSPISFFMTIPVPHILTSLSFGIGFIALGVLGIILSVYLSKLFIELTIRYVKWNIRLINGEEAR